MRLLNSEATNIKEIEEVALRDGLTLKVAALGLTYSERVEEELPSPTPPVKGPIKDDDGRIIRDGGRPVMEYDETDPDYTRRLNRINQLQTIKLITDAIEPGQIEFEASKDDYDDAADYYQAVREEMEAFGFGVGDLVKLTDAVGRLSGIDDVDLETAKAGFTTAKD